MGLEFVNGAGCQGHHSGIGVQDSLEGRETSRLGSRAVGNVTR